MRVLRNCPVTGKHSFRSEKQCEWAIRRMHVFGVTNEYKIPDHGYRCDDCGWWHLTSWTTQDNMPVPTHIGKHRVRRWERKETRI